MRTLLLDGDLLVYRVAHQCQQVIAWDHDTWTYYGDLAAARRSITAWLDRLTERLEADRTRVFLSDSKSNWRHLLLPSYKGNRAAWTEQQRGQDPLILPKPGPQRPILHGALREVLRDEFAAESETSLEADDLLGIFSTSPGGGQRIIVSHDKDMQTVPGLLFNPDHAEDGIRQITLAEADRYHLLQTLIGDATDNYKGCNGIGPVKAEKLLPPLTAWDGVAAWDAVLAAYEKAGLSEEDALVQARISRVLRFGEYNHTTAEVKLWEPPAAS